MIAERAAAALKESRRQRKLMDVGTPTWTGKSGLAGAPRFGNKSTNPFPINNGPFNNKFGSGNVSGFKDQGTSSSPKVSSSSLLAKMRERKAMETGVIKASGNRV